MIGTLWQFAAVRSNREVEEMSTVLDRTADLTGERIVGVEGNEQHEQVTYVSLLVGVLTTTQQPSVHGGVTTWCTAGTKRPPDCWLGTLQSAEKVPVLRHRLPTHSVRIAPKRTSRIYPVQYCKIRKFVPHIVWTISLDKPFDDVRGVVVCALQILSDEHQLSVN